MNTNFYVYVWFNIETFEIFYVGMGTGLRRYEIKKRNLLFKEYYQMNNCAVRLYKTGLSIDEAIKLEIELITKYNPCCNMTSGGEYSNGEKISRALRGRSLSENHKRNLRRASTKSWYGRQRTINGMKVVVLNKDKVIVKEFDAKYKVGVWLYNERGLGKNPRSIQRKIDYYFKSKELYNNELYFIENIDKTNSEKHN